MGNCENVDNSKAQTEETRKNIDSECAVEILKKGNARFVDNFMLNRNLRQEVRDTSGGQFPFAAVLSCLDSRVSAELIFDQGVGDVFNFRAAGNFVDQALEENNNILGSLEFASASGVRVILVLGHTGCGAIKAAMGPSNPDWCHPMARMVERLRTNFKSDDKAIATRQNVENTIEHIRSHSTCLKASELNKEIQIRGGVYNISTGKVTFYDYDYPGKENA